MSNKTHNTNNANGANNTEGITDEMIGQADKICACSAVVGDIIKATNEKKRKNFSWKRLLDGLKAKDRHGY